jgi:hypothetical protein
VIKAMLLAKRRASEPVSIRDLEHYSGLQRSTVIEALQTLTVPMFGNRVINGVQEPPIPLIAKGPVSRGMPTWYAPDRQARDWYWTSENLNAPARVEAARRRLWPALSQRNTTSKRRATKHPRLVR